MNPFWLFFWVTLIGATLAPLCAAYSAAFWVATDPTTTTPRWAVWLFHEGPLRDVASFPFAFGLPVSLLWIVFGAFGMATSTWSLSAPAAIAKPLPSQEQQPAYILVVVERVAQ